MILLLANKKSSGKFRLFSPEGLWKTFALFFSACSMLGISVVIMPNVFFNQTSTLLSDYQPCYKLSDMVKALKTNYTGLAQVPACRRQVVRLIS